MKVYLHWGLLSRLEDPMEPQLLGIYSTLEKLLEAHRVLEAYVDEVWWEVVKIDVSYLDQNRKDVDLPILTRSK